MAQIAHEIYIFEKITVMLSHLILLLSLGYCQKKKLPSGNFKFVDNPEDVAREIIANSTPEDSTGYIMKVDLVSKKVASHLPRTEPLV